MANYRPVQTETRKALDEIANKRKRGVNFGRPKPPEEFEASLREGGYYEPVSWDAMQDIASMETTGYAEADQMRQAAARFIRRRLHSQNNRLTPGESRLLRVPRRLARWCRLSTSAPNHMLSVFTCP